MATPYSTIYERSLQKWTDYEFANLPERDMEEMLHDWLLSAIAKFRQCKNDLSDRDEELRQFNVDLEDEEIEILAIMIVREWLQPQVHSALLTKQIFGGKEEQLGCYTYPRFAAFGNIAVYSCVYAGNPLEP